MKRRKFIQHGCAVLGYTTLFSNLINLKTISAAISSSVLAGDCDDYKALICFSLTGGNDSFNMLTPYKSEGDTGTAYDAYAGVRDDLALGLDDLIEIESNIDQGRRLSVHKGLHDLKDIYDQGDLAFISNIGSLVEPIPDRDTYYSGSLKVPLGLYSHADQQKHWQTANPLNRNATGWGGKVTEMIDQVNCNDAISMNVSLNGNNIFQQGKSSFAYAINRNKGSIGIQDYNTQNTYFKLRNTAIDNILDHDYQDAFKNAYADEIQNANDTHQLFSGAIENISLETEFGTSHLERSFAMIARTIKAANSDTELSKMKRQVFYVDLGGFDVHEEVIQNQNDSYEMINAALKSFYDEMKLAGLNDKVTCFTLSEFGRTLTSNGRGSDHGWGGNVFLMGGSVQGKSVYGTYPDLSLNTSLDVGGGVYIPTTSADLYFAEIALWFGVSKTELPLIFPNIGAFYDVYSSSPPLGILKL